MRPMNGKAREDARRQMEEAFGFVPDFYDAMPEAARASAWGLQRDLELSETTLGNKTKELIGLAIASHIKCRYCIHFHAEAAKAFGASEDEMREAIAMGGLTVLFSNALTGNQLDLDHFRKEVDRALEHVKKQQPRSQPQAHAGRH